MSGYSKSGRIYVSGLPRAVVMACLFLTADLFAATIDTSTYFANLRRKLSVDKKVSIAYFGGSITQGQGASDRAVTAWRPLTTTWFKTNFPQATVTEIDASWGATGSDLGAFRCTRDVSSKNPDLVFIEFAVNDWAKTSADIQPYMDGIIRNIWRTLPNCAMSIIYTVHNGTIGAYDNGTYPPAVLAQQAVADYYHVGSINVGKNCGRPPRPVRERFQRSRSMERIPPTWAIKFTRMK